MLEKCKPKFFVIVEGEEKACIRDSLVSAQKKQQKLLKYNSGKKVIIYEAEGKTV